MRSRPMPVSMDGEGSGRRTPSGPWSNSMKTRFQSSTKRSLPCSIRRKGSPASMSSPRSKWISEQGPQGPVSPMAQKLSFLPKRKIRGSGTPISLAQIR